MPRHRKKPRALLDYDTIAAASTGDPDAMAEVLRHFDGLHLQTGHPHIP